MKLSPVNNIENYNKEINFTSRKQYLAPETNDTFVSNANTRKKGKKGFKGILAFLAISLAACNVAGISNSKEIMGAAEEHIYTVQEGDTLSSIVRQYIGEDASWDSVSFYVEAIAENNNIEDPSFLNAVDENGNPTELDISCLVESDDVISSFDLDSEEYNQYTVQKGDTLASIVRQYIGENADWSEVSSYVYQLAEDNDIEDISVLEYKDENGNPVILDISCFDEESSNEVSFDMPSKTTPVTDSNGNIVASIERVNSKVENGVLSGKTILLNAGHGGFNPSNNIFDIGASNDEVEEYALTNRYTEMLAQKLVDEGADVVICQGSVRGESKSPVGNAIQDFADEFSEDIENTAFISIHFDSYENSDIKGGSVRYQEGMNSDFAQIICNSLIDNGIEMFKEAPVSDKLLVTNTASSNGINRSVLIECAALSNEEDNAKIQTEEFKEKITDAIVQGIIESFN